MEPFIHVTTVEFCHTDCAGIAHFSALMQFAEQAEHAFLRSIGFSVYSSSPGSITWPRVRVAADFLSPAFFEDVLRIELSVRRIGDSSVTYSSTIHGPSGIVASCESVCVCCIHSSELEHKLQKTQIPTDMREKLNRFLR